MVRKVTEGKEELSDNLEERVKQKKTQNEADNYIALTSIFLGAVPTS